jgi:hypothetical protein
VRYPDAQFEVTRGIDDPRAIHLTATADIKETDDLVDLVIDRLLELQVEERLPIHVIPIRAKERTPAAGQSPVSYSQAMSSNSPEHAA